jgi:hypothetical protein
VEDIHFDQHHAKELSDVKIEKWPVLNRLKAISIEAFHYWKALENL